MYFAVCTKSLFSDLDVFHVAFREIYLVMIALVLPMLNMQVYHQNYLSDLQDAERLPLFGVFWSFCKYFNIGCHIFQFNLT